MEENLKILFKDIATRECYLCVLRDSTSESMDLFNQTCKNCTKYNAKGMFALDNKKVEGLFNLIEEKIIKN